MDTLSTLIGFLVGVATSAAGQYFAEKYTDQRREKQRISDEVRLWQDIEQRFPAVISDMRRNFSCQENQHVRVFFVKKSSTSLGLVSEPCFEYHTDKHPNLRVAILHLEQHGFITDITIGNCPKYRMNGKLIDALRLSSGLKSSI